MVVYSLLVIRQLILFPPVLIRLPYFTFFGIWKELDALCQEIKKEEKN